MKRLDMAINLYHEYKQNEPVNIYVPGSVHKHNGISDKISLSEAGKMYLINKNVTKEDIFFAEEINIKVMMVYIILVTNVLLQ